ncbi:MAG: type IV pilus twitching motility protein PilT [Candidatus Omnitrophota bacterium]|jgi:twitching motility protein PilT
MEDIKSILIKMVENRASDLHITARAPMHYRVDGNLVNVSDKVLKPKEAQEVVFSLMTEDQKKVFEEEKELEFSFSIEGVARYRVTVFQQQSCVGCAIRMVPLEVWTIEECGLPQDIVRQFCNANQGLVLVTGPTGSGKSTTLAAMVDEINRTRDCHIVTIEDPIEFIHVNKKSIVDQREVFEDTHSFSNALKHVLRQDPDVILIGELRDLDTISHAMTIADTGHLVLGTLHTPDTIQTINRIIDVFPPYQQKQIRAQLSFVLIGMLAQQLLPRKDEPGQLLATEILVATPAIRSMIRDAKEHQLYSVLQTSQNVGMKTMNQALASLYLSGKISYERAISKTMDVEELTKLIEREGAVK